MQNILNPKTVALAQTVFYGLITVLLPQIINLITNGGVVIPYGLTGIVLVVLNYYENKLTTQNGGALFGLIS
jgi:hypothetical protein